MPLAFLSLTLSLGAAINTFGKEAEAAFPKVRSRLDTVGHNN